MRKSSILAFLFILNSFGVYAQGDTLQITERVERQRFSTVIELLTHKYGLKFAYDAGNLKDVSVDLNVNNASVAKLIDQLTASCDLCYRLISGTYTIYKCPQNESVKKPDYLKGIIRDSESGECLPYANILCDESEGTSSNQLGIFTVKYQRMKFIRLRISYMGFCSKDTMLWFGDSDSFHEFKLKRENAILKSVSVEGRFPELIEEGEEAGSVVFNPATATYLPNYGEPDALQSLGVLPGVCTIRNSGGLSIRGSLPYSNLILLDGFPVYRLDHYLGSVSTVNPKYIKAIKLSKGGFGANYGGSTAGVVDITGKTGNRNKPAFDVSLNLLSLNVLAELPISKKTTLLFAGRRSYIELKRTGLFKKLFKTSKSQKANDSSNLGDIAPDFYMGDYHLKLTHQQSAGESFSVSAYSSSDRLKYHMFSDSEYGYYKLSSNERWKNSGLGVSWDKQLSERLFTSLNMSISNFDKSSKWEDIFKLTEPDEYNPNVDSRNEQSNIVESIQLSSTNKLKISKKSEFDFGFKLQKNAIKSSYKDNSNEEYSYLFDTKEEATSLSLFGAYNLQPTKAITIVPGLRSTFFSLTRKLYFEPRLAVSYELSPKLSFNHEIGLYYQFLNNMSQFDELGNVTDYWTLGVNGVGPSESFHLQGGISWNENDWLVDVELYHRRTKNISASYFQQTYSGEDETTSIYDGNNYGFQKSTGIDLLVKKRFKRFVSMTSIAYGRTYNQFEDLNMGKYFPANNDRPVQIDLTTIYSIWKFHFSGKWSFASGKPVSEIDDILHVNRGRLPSNHSLDFSVVYDFNYNKVNGNCGVSLLNIYGRHNVLQRRFIGGYADESEYVGYETNIVSHGFIPVFFVNVRF